MQAYAHSGARAKARDNDKARRFVVACPDPTLPEKKAGYFGGH